MDNFNAILTVLQMAKAYQNMMVSAGYPTDVFDDEAIVTVELMLDTVEGNEDAS